MKWCRTALWVKEDSCSKGAGGKVRLRESELGGERVRLRERELGGEREITSGGSK